MLTAIQVMFSPELEVWYSGLVVHPLLCVEAGLTVSTDPQVLSQRLRMQHGDLQSLSLQ